MSIDSHAAGFAAGNDRAIQVMRSPHFAGREKQAARLLANEDLAADEICTLLADLAGAKGDAAAASWGRAQQRLGLRRGDKA